MSSPSADYPERLDPILLERQRRRYASRAIVYLVLLNCVAALLILGSLIHLAGEVPAPRKMADAMLVFGAGAAIALGSTFFAYLRRTVRLQAPQRIPLSVGLWAAVSLMRDGGPLAAYWQEQNARVWSRHSSPLSSTTGPNEGCAR
jgi:hypothetical protein